MPGVTVKLPDGASLELADGATGADAAAAIGARLAKEALAVRVDGEVRDLATPLEDGERIEILTAGRPEALEVLRHDCAHVLAEAVVELWPGTKVSIGPPIESGFYYDFEFPDGFRPTESDLGQIEERMAAHIAADEAFERSELAVDDAIARFREERQLYKVELIEDLVRDQGVEKVSLYRNGPFVDLCRGPHGPSTGRIEAFKLSSIAGAYWRGDETRQMLTRIYGTAFFSRQEREGVLHGLLRVRAFTQDDAHVYCTLDQVTDEVDSICQAIDELYARFGFDQVRVELSTRPDRHIGTDEQWERAEGALREALERQGREYEVSPGEGTFYGPKIDFHITDALGRSWQCGTCQLDFQMPERFELTYTGADNAEHRPVMIHRALLGSVERFAGILIEHYGGRFPVWLAPVQAIVLPISDRHVEYALEVAAELRSSGLRARVDERTESVGRKIRDAELSKAPYMLVLGDKEADAETVSVRHHGDGDLGAISVDALVE